MSNSIQSTIHRWSSICVIAGSILLTCGYWLRPYIEKEFVAEFAGEKALASTILVALGILLLLVGLPAVLSRQLISKGNIVSAGITFTGIAAFHLGTLSLYFVLPVLVAHSDDTMALIASDVPPFPYFAVFWAASLLIQFIGVLWLGINSWMAGIYPRGTAFLLIAGAFILLLAPVINFRLLQPGSTLIMAGFCWIASRCFTAEIPENEKEARLVL
jgi:hypothetical protein